MEKETMSVVTEIGTFGDLEIDDPTVTDVKNKKKDMDTLIKECVAENVSVLTGKD